MKKIEYINALKLLSKAETATHRAVAEQQNLSAFLVNHLPEYMREGFSVCDQGGDGLVCVFDFVGMGSKVPINCNPLTIIDLIRENKEITEYELARS